MEISIYKKDGSTAGTVALSPEIFEAEVKENVLYEAVRQYLAHQRQGTAKTKGRSEVSRTSKKAFRQKGTGGARRGSYRSPIVKGGGTVFGPTPRKYTVGLNRKMKQIARNSALTLKAADQAVLAVEDFSMDTPSTKSFKDVLQALNLEGKKVLFITNDVDTNLYLSSRNLPKCSLKPLNELNTYSIMHSQAVVFTTSALESLQKTVEAEVA